MVVSRWTDNIIVLSNDAAFTAIDIDTSTSVSVVTVVAVWPLPFSRDYIASSILYW